VSETSSDSATPSLATYSLSAGAAADVAAPDLDYRPPMPSDRSIGIGLIGAGGIAQARLDAYRAYGLNVVAIADRYVERAVALRDRYFPSATAGDDARAVIDDARVAVVDLATHPAERTPLMREALEAGRHVLSQKPFVEDLAQGQRLVELAERKGLQLAVNQNGRWAPHLAYIREAVRAGHLGEVHSLCVQIHWDHSWVKGTRFADMPFLILEDFAIHWFDFAASVLGAVPMRVRAVNGRSERQTIAAPLLAQIAIEFPGGQASLTFDGAAAYGATDFTVVSGSGGAARATGPDLGTQTVELFTAAGRAIPRLEGKWFNDGFAGAMGALLCAVESGRTPINNARDNLWSLRICRAAIDSARDGAAVDIAPSEV
jgi:predicted dehydrogenase